jgi:hypothetical protein
MIKSLLVVFIMTFSLVFTSCEPEPFDPYQCSSKTVTYTSHIKKIIDHNCATAGCHDAKTRARALDMSTYVLLNPIAQKVNFIGCIKHETSYSAMPLYRNKLATDSINIIYCWIKNGLPR